MDDVIGQIDYQDELYRLLDSVEIENSIHLSYVLKEAYDLMYGIYTKYDDETVVRPLAVVAMHDTVNVTSGTLYDRWLRMYVDSEVGSSCHVTWGEFLQMDVMSANQTLQVARDVQRAKKQMAESVSSDLKELQEAVK